MVQLEKRSKKNKNYLGIDIYKRFFIDQKKKNFQSKEIYNGFFTKQDLDITLHMLIQYQEKSKKYLRFLIGRFEMISFSLVDVSLIAKEI